MADHTPGPWKYLEYPDSRIRSGNTRIAKVHVSGIIGEDIPDSISGYIANGYLMAAAPDLLAVCECHEALVNYVALRGGNAETTLRERTIVAFRRNGYTGDIRYNDLATWLDTKRIEAIAKAKPPI